MFLKKLYLKNFRNYKEELVSFGPGLNLIYGDNGQGKTNLLEAIYFLSTGRSFRTSNLQELISHGEEEFSIVGFIEKDGIEQKLSLRYSKNEKLFLHNQTKYANFTNILGIFPSVIFTPSDIQLINGSPIERRRFLNLHIAQYSPLYVYHLARFSKGLKHRNTLLKQKSTDTIFAWEKEMAKSAFYVFSERKKALKQLQLIIEEERKASSFDEQVLIKYYPHCKVDSHQTIEKAFIEARDKDMVIGYTSIGPHRDDFSLYLSQKLAKNYASEGQKRTLIALIRIAQHKLFMGEFNSNPLFSIDDFGIHLDLSRKTLFGDYLTGFEQSVITSPHKEQVSYQHAIMVQNGKCYS